MTETKLCSRRFLALALPLTLLLLAGAGVSPSLAQVGSWGYSGHVGVLGGTVDGSSFALGFTPEYYLAPAFSVGGDFVLSPTGDLTLLSGAATARWHFNADRIEITPFIGLGLVYADFDRGGGIHRFNEDDFSYVIPLGIQVDHAFKENLSVGGTFALNLTGLDFGGPVGSDESYTTFFVTLRYRP